MGGVGAAVGVRPASRSLAGTKAARASLETLWAVRRLASPALARLPENRRSLQVVEDGCVPLERLADYVTGIRAAAAARGIPVAIFGHAGDGHVHVNALDRKSTRLNSSHGYISYAVFCLKKKTTP